MKSIAATMISLSMAGSAMAQAEQELKLSRVSSRPSLSGSIEHFTGRVRVSALFADDEFTSGTGSASESLAFDPGARSAWHTHPAGQTLIVTSGTGRIQRWGAPTEELRAGDVVWIPPRQKHWHGATPTEAMTCVAIQDSVQGRSVAWLEKVSAAQYRQCAPQALT